MEQSNFSLQPVHKENIKHVKPFYIVFSLLLKIVQRQESTKRWSQEWSPMVYNEQVQDPDDYPLHSILT